MNIIKKLREFTREQWEQLQDCPSPAPEQKKEEKTTSEALIELAENAEYIIYKINEKK